MSKRVWLNGAVGVRGIAIIEAIKGLLVLLVGFGLLSLAHRVVEQFASGTGSPCPAKSRQPLFAHLH